jgi:hypothetical protein
VDAAGAHLGSTPLVEFDLVPTDLGVKTFTTPANYEILSPGRHYFRAEYLGTSADGSGPTGRQTVGVAGYYGSQSDRLTHDVYLSGLIGLNSVTIGSSSGFADSFHGAYPATQAKRARVLSNGPITLKGTVLGNILSAGGSVILQDGSLVDGNVTGVSISGPGVVTGTKTQHSSALMTPLDPVLPCTPMTAAALSSLATGNYSYQEKNGTFSMNGQTVATFSPGFYCFRAINLTGGATIRVVTGPVTIRLTGTLGANGGSFANLTAIPSNLRIESAYTGNGGVVLGGSNNSFLTVYAPTTDVSLQGGNFFGAVLGRTLTVQGGTMVHNDNASDSTGWAIWTAWREFFRLPVYP